MRSMVGVVRNELAGTGASALFPIVTVGVT